MARNSRDQQLIEMKDTIKELNITIKDLRMLIEELKKREAEYLEKDQNQQAQIDYLTKKLFGRKSENRHDDFEGQLNLFNEAELENVDPEPEESTVVVKEHVRKQKAKAADKFANLPVKKVYLDVPEDKRVCPECGTPLQKIGEEFIRFELEIIKPSMIRIEYYSINYGCPKCKVGDDVPCIVQGRDGHIHMLHGMASASTVAWVMYQKYVNALPLYRQERDFKSLYNVDICRGTLANWIITNALDFFAPLCDYFRRKLVGGRYAMADETPVQVLKEDGRRAQTKSYMCYVMSSRLIPKTL